MTKEQREALERAVKILLDDSERPSYDWDEIGGTLRTMLSEEPSHADAIRRLKAMEASIVERFHEEGPIDHPVNIPIFQEQGLRWANELAGVIRMLEESR